MSKVRFNSKWQQRALIRRSDMIINNFICRIEQSITFRMFADWTTLWSNSYITESSERREWSELSRSARHYLFINLLFYLLRLFGQACNGDDECALDATRVDGRLSSSERRFEWCERRSAFADDFSYGQRVFISITFDAAALSISLSFLLWLLSFSHFVPRSLLLSFYYLLTLSTLHCLPRRLSSVVAVERARCGWIIISSFALFYLFSSNL